MTQREKAGPLFVGGMGLLVLVVAAVVVALANVGDIPALIYVAYVVAGIGALIMQVAIIGAGVRLGVYHGNLDVEDEPT